MTRILATSEKRWRAWLVVMLTSLAMAATSLGLAQPAHAAPISAGPVVPREVIAPLTDKQVIALAKDKRIIAMAKEVQKTLTPAERMEVKRILAQFEKRKGGATTLALPAIAAYAVWLIVRFGIPWLIQYASNVFYSVFLSRSIKLLVCQELRRQGNGWGWSWYCSGTY